MRLLLLAAAFSLIAGCSSNSEEPPPWAYARLSDSLKAASFGKFGEPCVKNEKILGDEIEVMESPTECFRYGLPWHYKGIWLYEFEASHFLQNATTAPNSWRHTPDVVHLTFADEQFWDRYPPVRRRAFYIEFIGRKMLHTFKLNGDSEGFVRVDKITEIRELKAPAQTEFCDPDCKTLLQVREELRARHQLESKPVSLAPPR